MRIRLPYIGAVLLWLNAVVLSGTLASEWLRVPDTPASVPLILAAMEMPELDVRTFSGHAQVHALFAKGDVRLMATGLSAGICLFQNGVPVRMVNAYVSGMTWMVADRRVSNLSDLEDTGLILPFEGSPIDEVTRFFVKAHGLGWNDRIPVQYMMFQGSLRLLTLGRIRAAALPEPWATMAEQRPGLYRGISYKALWHKYSGQSCGYPQVGVFVRTDAAAAHPALVSGLNQALEQALIMMTQNPDRAVLLAAPYLHFEPELIRASLDRMAFELIHGPVLKDRVTTYYRIIGKPLDEAFEHFF